VCTVNSSGLAFDLEGPVCVRYVLVDAVAKFWLLLECIRKSLTGAHQLRERGIGTA
jgi:hypothetical protein